MPSMYLSRAGHESSTCSCRRAFGSRQALLQAMVLLCNGLALASLVLTIILLVMSCIKVGMRLANTHKRKAVQSADWLKRPKLLTMDQTLRCCTLQVKQ